MSKIKQKDMSILEGFYKELEGLFDKYYGKPRIESITKLGFYPERIPQKLKKNKYYNHPGFDHPQIYADENGTKHYVSHPYQISMEDVEALIEWCKEKGYRFYIHGRSDYYPGHTIAIEIYGAYPKRG